METPIGCTAVRGACGSVPSIDTVLRDAQAVSYLASIGQSVSKRGPPEAVGEFLRQQRMLWAAIYKDLGIEPQ